MMRLNKFLAESGVASRRKADELIVQGRVDVNLKTISELGYEIDETKDVVMVDGEKVKIESKVYYILNKPKGYVTTTSDERHRPTVVQLIKTNKAIFPVGRLDFNTTGILLLTNDGEFANKLTHPSFKAERIYTAKLNYDLDEKHAEKLLNGIMIERRKSKFTICEVLGKNNKTKIKVGTLEGRNHFVKKMFETLGYKVLELNRESFGKFKLGTLPLGHYIELTKSEIDRIISK
jgi:23S rRNA pseudouridine2605 synthase